MNTRYKLYIDEVTNDITALYTIEESGLEEDKFVQYYIDVLESLEKTENPQIISYTKPNSFGDIEWKINGFALKDFSKYDDEDLEGFDTRTKTIRKKEGYFKSLDLYIAYYDKTNFGQDLKRKDSFEKPLKYITKFLKNALNNGNEGIDESNQEIIDLLYTIKRQNKFFDRINIIYLINGVNKYEANTISFESFPDLNINIDIWDTQRFFQIHETNSEKEPIVIEFEKESISKQKVPCLKIPLDNDTFDCYLAMIPGEILADLYGKYSNEILESNVRAYLGESVYNKKIKATIKDKPEMFLPYNNGISATAENITTEMIDGQLYIKSLKDFQIVNGGQTTASIFYARKKSRLDISQIYVQMKLTIIKDVELKNEEVPRIAEYANSQNKVNTADFRISNPAYIAIEKLSRTSYVVNPSKPEQSIRWYFERVKGQYNQETNKFSSKTDVNKFLLINPKSNKFIKEDLARSILLWQQLPSKVALGKAKYTEYFVKSTDEFIQKNKLPNQLYYKIVISNLLLYKEVDFQFGRKNAKGKFLDAIGDTNSKATIVAYTIAYFHYITNNCINVEKIYDDQIIDLNFAKEFRKLLIFIQDSLHELMKKEGVTLLSMFARNEKTWNEIKKLNYNFPVKDYPHYFVKDNSVFTEIYSSNKSKHDEELIQLENYFLMLQDIYSFDIKFWDGFYKYYSTNDEKFTLYNINEFEIKSLINAFDKHADLSESNIKTAKLIIRAFNDHIFQLEEVIKLSDKESIERPDLYLTFKSSYEYLINDIEKIKQIQNDFKKYNENEYKSILSLYNTFKKSERPKISLLYKVSDLLIRTKNFKKVSA